MLNRNTYVAFVSFSVSKLNTNENSSTIVKELVIHDDGADVDDGAFYSALLWSTTSSCVSCVYGRP